MANSATLIGKVPVCVGDSANPSEYEIVYDTANNELDVITASKPTNCLFVVGVALLESAPINVTFMGGVASGGANTRARTFELAGSQGWDGEIKNSFYFCTNPGETLKIKSTGAIQSTPNKNFVLTVLEAPVFRIQ